MKAIQDYFKTIVNLDISSTWIRQQIEDFNITFTSGAMHTNVLLNNSVNTTFPLNKLVSIIELIIQSDFTQSMVSTEAEIIR